VSDNDLHHFTGKATAEKVSLQAILENSQRRSRCGSFFQAWAAANGKTADNRQRLTVIYQSR